MFKNHDYIFIRSLERILRFQQLSPVHLVFVKYLSSDCLIKHSHRSSQNISISKSPTPSSQTGSWVWNLLNVLKWSHCHVLNINLLPEFPHCLVGDFQSVDGLCFERISAQNRAAACGVIVDLGCKRPLAEGTIDLLYRLGWLMLCEEHQRLFVRDWLVQAWKNDLMEYLSKL